MNSVRRGISPAVLLLMLLGSSGCGTAPSVWLYRQTGEEKFLPQLRAVLQLTTDQLRPRPRTAPMVAIQHAGVNPFGVNVFLEQEVEPWKRERTVQMVAAAGFHWMRQEFPWEDIEIHGKGDFEDRRHEPFRSAWEKYDHIVALTEKYGLELIVRLSNPPEWTRADGAARGSFAPPDHLSDWGDYVYTVVSRYRGRVRYYQLWNEPNIYPEWGEQPVNPEAYTALLCEGYRRAKEADPSVVILSGALAPTVSLHPGPGPALGLNEFVFLQRMYDAGAGACFDILTVNDYLLWSGPTDRRLEPLNINFSRPLYLRDIMVANGDAHKPIWISEMNSNAVPNDPTILGWGNYGQVTLEQQARYAVEAYERVMREWPWAGVVVFWFFKRASDAERDQAWYYFRMVEPDFTPLPVYDALRSYTAALKPTLYPGIHQEGHWALEYLPRDSTSSGTSWEQAEGSWKRTGDAGASVQFTYEGAGLVLVPGPGLGTAEVRVDNRAPRVITLNGRPVRITGGRGACLTTWVCGRHTIALRNIAGELSIDQLIVEPSCGERWIIILFAIGLVAGAVLGWYVAGHRSVRRR